MTTHLQSQAIPRPDLSQRPLQVTCERVIHAAPSAVFAAWTSDFEAWFAQAGTVVLQPEAGAAYFFYNRDDWGRHPHYGRFLEVIPEQLVEMTWVTGNGTADGTAGAETVLRIDLTPAGADTRLVLTHSGFASEASRAGHEENWPLALDVLEATIGTAS